MKFKKRYILLILLVAFLFLLADAIINWESTKASFEKGYNEAAGKDIQKK